MDVTLENEDLIVQIKSKGAELFRVYNKATALEYMWSGDPKFWGKTSPVLFPIVGTLKGDKYNFQGKSYNLSRHGFARDGEFEVKGAGNDRFDFIFSSNESSLLKYPFPFQLTISYSLEKNQLLVTYLVENRGKPDMFFSLGAHPAFKVPLIDRTVYTDYYLQFNKIENTGRWPISPQGLIEAESIPFLNQTDKVDLHKSLFQHDAIVLKHLSSDCVSLKSTKHSHGFDFHFKGFPYLGIWAAKDADFVCIEPWCGIADSVNHNQDFTSKEGIESIGSGKTWMREWKVKFY